MRNLKTVLENDYGLDLTGWELHRAYGISDDGSTIVSSGVSPNGPEAWMVRFSEVELQIISVENGMCHMKWSPAVNYTLQYFGSPGFESIIDSIDVGDTVTEYYYDAGAATSGFFRLAPRP